VAAREGRIGLVKVLWGRKEALLFVVSTSLLIVGAVAWLLDRQQTASFVWYGDTVLGLAASVGWMTAAIRRREMSVDIIAVLALAGAVLVREPFAGAMITVMLASGQLLETRAQARARRDLALLVERAPRTAMRRLGDTVVEVPVTDVVVGDRLLVRSGETVPVDGRLARDALLDESTLTGEALPVHRPAGDDVRSGVLNAGSPVELVATTTAANSTYAGLVRLVEEAQAASAPFVRSADRIAVIFVPLTVLMAAAAWVISGDPVRAVAVLVVATPCPLLLAAPIAFISGLSRSARVGVVVKGGGALERLAVGRVMLFDKTGTLTVGKPVVTEVITASADTDADTLLRLAGSLDQVSPHVLATAIVTAATQRQLRLELPDNVVEEHGYGVRGHVAGHDVRLGKASWVIGSELPSWARQARRRADLDGSLTVFVAIDGRAAGAFLLEDTIRPDAPRMIRRLRAAGIQRIVLVTGDRADIAQTVGRIVGLDTVLADRDPADKLAAVASESTQAPTIMVGDGVNDAPALASAGVGVALAARGATASSAAADVVLTVDRIGALAEAMLIARRSKRIALQAVTVGMGLSLVAMVAAAAGWLPPAAGAALQEAIDVLAIGVALRAVIPGRRDHAVLPEQDLVVARRLKVQHDATQPVVAQIRSTADGLSTQSPDLSAARLLLDRLENELLPHERADEQLLVPMVARATGGTAATTAISRTHAEIESQVGRVRRLLDDVDDGHVEAEDVIELRRILYGLYAITRLHNAQEEEEAHSLVSS
jgi:heavy metal translocating P-type ATPase